MTVETGKTGFEVVDGSWQLDLQAHRDLGLYLGPLEDPSDKGMIPVLRSAAAAYQESPWTATADALHATHRRVKTFMRDQGDKHQLRANRGVELSHPAIQRYIERNPSALERSERGPGTVLEGMLNSYRLGWFYLTLVRPYAEGEKGYDPELERFTRVAIEGTNYYNSPLEVASQLMVARAAITFDI